MCSEHQCRQGTQTNRDPRSPTSWANLGQAGPLHDAATQHHSLMYSESGSTPCHVPFNRFATVGLVRIAHSVARAWFQDHASCRRASLPTQRHPRVEQSRESEVLPMRMQTRLDHSPKRTLRTDTRDNPRGSGILAGHKDVKNLPRTPAGVVVTLDAAALSFVHKFHTLSTRDFESWATTRPNKNRSNVLEHTPRALWIIPPSLIRTRRERSKTAPPDFKGTPLSFCDYGTTIELDRFAPGLGHAGHTITRVTMPINPSKDHPEATLKNATQK